ncbi:hypothetical protein AMTR_s00070p00107950 [Amborella trichopoda]|uniref:Uncharacterized protein n=1 Tax=Amborella trichopoda TaxID=13333 RepID=U5DGK1_AMBTC|nr:hypothetical protein AMTR_s00070p00107950 [Amborella trichopoda]
MSTSRIHPPDSSTAQSSGLHASGGPVASSPLGPRAAARAMTPPGFGSPMTDVPPLDVVGFPIVPRLPSNFKASMVRGMLCSGIDGMSLIGAQGTDGGF